MTTVIDWPDFWSREGSDVDWLIDPVIAACRAHVIYARHGRGKSLFLLWCALEAIKRGDNIVVIYLDFEMVEDDLRERLTDMGHGPDTDLERLRYYLLPSIPPLDTVEGAAALVEIINAEQLQFPDAHFLVCIDPFGRAVHGPENDNDTARNFDRHTGMMLKRAGCTWVRLDNSGWDESKGARGGSAKGDDPDIVWRLEEKDGGLDLVRVKTRIAWVPDRVSLGRGEEPVLSYRPAANWASGTFDTAGILDRLGFPLDGSTRAAQAALREAGEGRRKAVVLDALKYRRVAAEAPGTTPETRPEANSGTTLAADGQEWRNHRQEPPPEPPGTVGAGHKGGVVFPVGEPPPSPDISGGAS